MYKNEKVQKFLQLVQEHPDYKVLPLVATDVIAGDEYCSWFGSIGNSYIGEFCHYTLPYIDRCLWERDDCEELEQYLWDEWIEAHPDVINYEEGAELYVKEQMEKLNWEKCIVLWISEFEGI